MRKPILAKDRINRPTIKTPIPTCQYLIYWEDEDYYWAADTQTMEWLTDQRGQKSPMYIVKFW